MSKGLFENRILIVDDNGDLRRMLGTFLKKEGYQNVALAEDCRSALSEIGARGRISSYWTSICRMETDFS